tara:strand:+ start:787 stop:1419 length:633 start_codon:yes stop_codon:yes gene_type:complete
MKKVLFLLDKKNDWIKQFIIDYNFSLKKKFTIKVSYNKNLIKKYDIIFLINYLKILSKNTVSKNFCLLVHESNLPKDKGGAPIQNQILRGKKKIHLSLIKVTEKLDSGDIYLKSNFKLDGSELNNEIRKIQALKSLDLIKKFLNNLKIYKPKKQIGISTYNKLRTGIDSLIDVKKSIKDQFNLLRVCDNERYPAYFIFKKKRYILKIYKK